MRHVCVFFALLAATAGAAPNFPCGTFTISGSAANWKNVLYTAENDVTLQAVSTNGVILAETEVKTAEAGSEGRNFALRVPLTTVATDKTAAVGDAVNLFLIEGGVTNVAANGIVLFGADAWTNVALRVVNAVAFSSSGKYAQGGQVQVSSSYLASIRDWLDYYEKKSYEPDADYDGDGVDNYTEYLSATNPFDPSDKLVITAFSLTPDQVELKFEYAGGVVYGIGTATNLVRQAWTRSPFALKGEGNANRQQVLFANATDEDDIGTAEVLLVPVKDSPARFYRVNVESGRSLE